MRSSAAASGTTARAYDGGRRRPARRTRTGWRRPSTRQRSAGAQAAETVGRSRGHSRDRRGSPCAMSGKDALGLAVATVLLARPRSSRGLSDGLPARRVTSSPRSRRPTARRAALRRSTRERTRPRHRPPCAPARSSRSRRRATPTTWSARHFFDHVTPGGSRSATGSTRPATSRRAATGSSARRSPGPSSRSTRPRPSCAPGWPARRTARSSSIARFRDVGIGVDGGADRRLEPGSAPPRVLDFGFRTLVAYAARDGARRRRARARARTIAARARSVRIDLDALEALEPGAAARARPRAPLPGGPGRRRRRLPPDARRDQLRLGLVPDAAQARRARSGYFTVAWALADRCARRRRWTNAELRAMRTEEVADTLGQRRDHELMALFAQALRELGALPRRPARARRRRAGAAARRCAWPRCSPAGWRCAHDRGFYKRAQIAASDLALAGVADVRRPRRADDLRRQPRAPRPALRGRARLRRRPGRAHRRRAARCAPARRSARSARCAVHACAADRRSAPAWTERDARQRALVPRRSAPEYKARPRHRCRTVFY